MKNKEYYYLENNQTIGPLNLADLVAVIDRDTMVWRDGIQWTVAFQVAELKPLVTTSKHNPVVSPKQNEETNYYYSVEGDVKGPFNLANLLTKIDGNTLVWREGIDWTAANSLVELKSLLSSEPPRFKSEQNNLEYYYLENNETVGPLSIESLVKKIAGKMDTMIWREGIEWTVAGELKELNKLVDTSGIIPDTKSKPSKIKAPTVVSPLLSKPKPKTAAKLTAGNKSGANKKDEVTKPPVIDLQPEVVVNKATLAKLENKASVGKRSTDKNPIVVKTLSKKTTQKNVKPTEKEKFTMSKQKKQVAPKNKNIQSPSPAVSKKDTRKVIANDTPKNKTGNRNKNESEKLKAQQTKIVLILTNLKEKLIKAEKDYLGKLYITPNINSKKFNNLKKTIGDPVGSDLDCLMYYDNTIFGKGDAGFIATENVFAWRNSFEQLSYFIPWNKIITFKVEINNKKKNDNLILKKTDGRDFLINIKQLPFSQLFVDALNKLLKILSIEGSSPYFDTCFSFLAI